MENRRKGVFAFGKQTAAGSPLAAPTFAVPKLGGGIAPDEDRADLPLTGHTAGEWGEYKQRARGAGTVRILCHMEAVGLLLYEACGAQAFAAGTGGAVNHTFTLVDTIPFANPLTVWDLVGDNWERFSDCFVSKLTIRGTSGENVEVELELLAFTAVPVAAPTYTLIDAVPRAKFIGSTSKLEADNATPATVTNVENVELVIDRSGDTKYGGSLTPVLWMPNRHVGFGVGVVYDTSGNNQGWDFINATFFGGTAGVTQSQDIVKGSFEHTFGRHPALAGRFLKIASNGANWNYRAPRPESDAGGGPLEYDIDGPVVRPSGGGTEVTITLANEFVGAY